MGRDVLRLSVIYSQKDFNPRAPHGARPRDIVVLIDKNAFQSTRPAWGATIHSVSNTAQAEFQSTRPAWGATYQDGIRCNDHTISIHAPRMGRDMDAGINDIQHENFNPRAPHGARPWVSSSFHSIHRFQSTRPAWGATLYTATIVS